MFTGHGRLKHYLVWRLSIQRRKERGELPPYPEHRDAAFLKQLENLRMQDDEMSKQLDGEINSKRSS